MDSPKSQLKRPERSSLSRQSRTGSLSRCGCNSNITSIFIKLAIMYRASYLVCVLILLATGASGQEKPVDGSDPLTWSTYTVKGEEFSVTLPSRPSLATSKKERSEPQLAISWE